MEFSLLYRACECQFTYTNRLRRIINVLSKGHSTHSCVRFTKISYMTNVVQVVEPHKGRHVCRCGFPWTQVIVTSE
jgi:hypothetical protein